MDTVPARTPKQPEALIAVVEPLTAATPVERTFEEMYRRLAPLAVRRSELVIGREAAWDVVQAVALELWPRWTKIPLAERNDNLFLTAVRFRVIDYRRRMLRDRELIERLDEVERLEKLEALPAFEVPPVDPFTNEIDIAKLYRRLIETMAERRRVVWVLVVHHQCSYEQVAERMEVDYKTVSRHMNEARDWMIQRLSRFGIAISAETLRQLLPTTTSEAHDG